MDGSPMEAVTTGESELAELPAGSEVLIWLTADGVTESSESFGAFASQFTLPFPQLTLRRGP